jgi:ABC-type branched-subunit amino acid transport system ATPase component
VIDSVDLSKAYGDKLLFESMNFHLPRAGIVGVVGANGAGKTTLFKIITGLEKADSGKLTLGETVKLSYVDQSRDALTDENTVFQEITGGTDIIRMGKMEINSRAYVGKFNFGGSDQQKLVKIFRAASAIGSILPSCCKQAVMSCCLMNQQTTLTLKHCRLWSRPLALFPDVLLLSRTIDGF